MTYSWAAKTAVFILPQPTTPSGTDSALVNVTAASSTVAGLPALVLERAASCSVNCSMKVSTSIKEGLYFTIEPILIAPVSETVTFIVALLTPSETVITAEPAATEVIFILPIAISTVTTFVLLDTADVPTKPSVAISFAIVSFTDEENAPFSVHFA